MTSSKTASFKGPALLIGVLALGAIAIWLGLQTENTDSGAAWSSDSKTAPDAVASNEPMPLGEALHSEQAREAVQGEAKVAAKEQQAKQAPTAAPEDLLAAIRSAENQADPHAVAWPFVEQLAALVTARSKQGASIADDLAAELHGSETAFVRGAVLLALGLSLPNERALALAEPLILEPPGELARAAWLVLTLAQAPPDQTGKSLNLASFDRLASRTRGDIWPVELPSVSPDAAAVSLERALSHLTPPAFYLDALKHQDLSESESSEGVLTREVILLATLAVPGQEPGPAQDMLLKWMSRSDMDHACIWSLCVAARDDDGLANRLHSLLLSLDLFSDPGRTLSQMLGGVADRGDLLLDLLLNEIGTNETGDPTFDLMENVDVLFAIGEILNSKNETLADQALEALVDLTLDAEQSPDLRSLTLAQLSVARPERVSQAIELILISQDQTQTREWAAALATSVPVDQQERMRSLLIDTFDYGTATSKTDSIKSLAYFGGDKVLAFFTSITGNAKLEPKAQAMIDEFLSSATPGG